MKATPRVNKNLLFQRIPHLAARRPDEERLKTWRRGVVLEDGNRIERADVRFESAFGRGAWLRVALRAGKKRQIGEVVKIIRTLIGSLVLGGLRPGE